jgi:hypothetical protein
MEYRCVRCRGEGKVHGPPALEELMPPWPCGRCGGTGRLDGAALAAMIEEVREEIRKARGTIRFLEGELAELEASEEIEAGAD